MAKAKAEGRVALALLLLRGFRKFCAVVGRVELILGGTLLVFMTVIITVQVVLRSIFDRPISWMEEIVTYTLVWLTFIGASFALKQLRHVTITTPISSLDEKQRGLLRLLADVIIVWVLATIAFFAYKIIPIEGSAKSVALPIDIPRAAFFSVALFVNVIVMNITMLYYLIVDILAMAGKAPPGERRVYPLWKDGDTGGVGETGGVGKTDGAGKPDGAGKTDGAGDTDGTSATGSV